MDCPKCKNPNPPEATYCGMCYEKFLHSAADAYLRTMRRARMKRGDAPEEAVQSSKKQKSTSESFMNTVPWSEIAEGFRLFFGQFGRFFLYIGIFAGVGIGIRLAMDPQIRASLLGVKIIYASKNKPVSYISGFQSKVAIRAERQTGDLYTPVDTFQANELTNVDIQKGRIQVPSLMLSINRGNRSQDVMLPASHPTIAPAAFTIDEKGMVTQRERSSALRTNRISLFVVPALPKNRIKPGETWTEQVAWIDMAGDWRVRWGGTRKWRMEEMVPCGKNVCARLSYAAEIRPQIFGRPEWMSEGASSSSVSVGRGDVFFDMQQHVVRSHTFSYNATIRMVMNNLGRIPSNKRVGRRVFHTPGSLILELQNKIAVTKKSTPSDT